MTQLLQNSFFLGPWEIRPTEGRFIGPDKSVRVGPKILEVLLILAENANEVVTREAILDRVWPGVFGADESLTRCISELRNHLGDQPSHPRYLETIPKRGYRLIAQITLNEADSNPDQPATNKSQPPPRSIAVMAFVNMSDDPEMEYLSDGVAVELLNALSKIDGLQVAARISSFAFKGKNDDIRTIGDRLNVKTVLDGSVRKVGDQLRITSQLIDVENGFVLWSDQYDRKMKDIFATQDEIAHNITHALKVTLSPSEQQAIKAPATEQFLAYDHYLRGWNFIYRFGPKNLNLARAMFQQAINSDSEYGPAWAGLAISTAFLHIYYDPNPKLRPQCDQASLRALQHTPDLPESCIARALALHINNQFQDAEIYFQRSIELNPNRFESYYCFARMRIHQGRHRQAIELFEKAMEVEPDDYQSPLLLVGIYNGLGEHEKAHKVAQQGVEIAQSFLKINPNDARALCLSSDAWVELGATEKARDWVLKAIKIDPEDPATLYNAACFYTSQGEYDKALDVLEKILKPGTSLWSWIKHDHDFKALRTMDRYQHMTDKFQN